jgi:hypothetical protein
MGTVPQQKSIFNSSTADDVTAEANLVSIKWSRCLCCSKFSHVKCAKNNNDRKTNTKHPLPPFRLKRTRAEDEIIYHHRIG